MPNEDLIATLNPTAASTARAFLTRFPEGALTSARRSVDAQADAMAADVVQDPGFIQKTYAKDFSGKLISAAAQACQTWVDANASCQSGDVISAAFKAILSTFSEAELEHLSYHLGGNAFDVHVDGDPAKVAWLQKAASNVGGKFLDHEGGLPRWHWQGV